MLSYILTILILILIPFIIFRFWSIGTTFYENFVNENKDQFTDILYTKLYNIVFNYTPLIQKDSQEIQHFLQTNNIPKNAPILEIGTGVGKHYQELSKFYTNIIGTDISQNALDIAETLTPQGTFIKANMQVQNSFQQNQFQVILTLMETLYYAQSQPELHEILQNIKYWLLPNGYYITHLFDPTNLDPAPREFSMTFNKENSLHALTYFNDFTHDAWWTPSNNNNGNTGDNFYIYTQKFILENGRILVKPTQFFIPSPQSIIKLLQELGFKLIQVKNLNDVDAKYIKLYMFQLIK